MKTLKTLCCLSAIAVVLTSQGCMRQGLLTPVKYFYIDKTGKKVLDGMGFYGDSFHEGLALVCDEYHDDGGVQPFRYIDQKGNTQFTISGYRAYPFSEGVAAITAKVDGVNGGCAGYIDKAGKWVLPPRFYGYGDSFSDGLALVTTPGWRLQYIDHSGKQHLDASRTFSSCKPIPWHQNLRPFSEDLALIRIGEYGNCASKIPWQYGYVDKHGDWKIELSPNSGSQFCEGLASRFLTSPAPKEPRTSFVDKSGKEILSLPFYAGNFSEGLCAITNRAVHPWGYCDLKGKVVITPQFEIAQEFSEGLAAVRLGGKTGYIDKTGKFVIKPQFAYAGDFSEGVAVVVPFSEEGRRPELKLWGQPSGKYFARNRIEWVESAPASD